MTEKNKFKYQLSNFRHTSYQTGFNVIFIGREITCYYSSYLYLDYIVAIILIYINFAFLNPGLQNINLSARSQILGRMQITKQAVIVVLSEENLHQHLSVYI